MAKRKLNHQWERVKRTKLEPKYKVTNREFAQKNKEFIEICVNAGVEPTSRQASKYRNKKGLAFKKS